MVVQDYASGQTCCVNQYHYESQLIHTTGKIWYIVLCQHTMYVISLSNISIKANVKQITRLELLFTILWGRLHCVNDVTFFVAVLSPMSITAQSLSVSLYNPKTLLKRKRGPYNCGNIDTISLRCLHWCFFRQIPMIWHHDKGVRQRTSRATSHNSFITTVWW